MPVGTLIVSKWTKWLTEKSFLKKVLSYYSKYWLMTSDKFEWTNNNEIKNEEWSWFKSFPFHQWTVTFPLRQFPKMFISTFSDLFPLYLYRYWSPSRNKWNNNLQMGALSTFWRISRSGSLFTVLPSSTFRLLCTSLPTKLRCHQFFLLVPSLRIIQ